MLGYWNDAEQTAEAIDQAGWMHTGDLATIGLDGYVNIVGRSKDMIIRGGENIYPRESEEFLYSHPQIKDVRVVGVPDARYGEEIAARNKPLTLAVFGVPSTKSHYRPLPRAWASSLLPRSRTSQRSTAQTAKRSSRSSPARASSH
ncbi:MAG TPA: hypothetical protein VMJ65_14050 [Solirubrobacteraceae bacterium]|nr:hypothetical protein [Solirubrobacteraceae bacterium]